LVSALALLEKMRSTRDSPSPLCSSGTRVLSKVAGSGFAVIEATAASWSAIPSSSAGAKSSSVKSAKRGSW
jgi:hypothetical protein